MLDAVAVVLGVLVVAIAFRMFRGAQLRRTTAERAAPAPAPAVTPVAPTARPRGTEVFGVAIVVIAGVGVILELNDAASGLVRVLLLLVFAVVFALYVRSAFKEQ